MSSTPSRFPDPPAALQPTPRETLDQMVQTLADNKEAWTKVTLDERIALLEALAESIGEVAHEWGELGSIAKGFTPDEAGWGEEFLVGPVPTLTNIEMLVATLKQVRADGAVKIPEKRISERADGRVVVQVFPNTLEDRAFLTGVTAEVWQQPEVTRGTLSQNIGQVYRTKVPGKVALVLGAGNQSAIPPTDVVYKLFNENEVVLLKMNPVNEYLGPIFERLFAPMIRRGFVQICYGGRDEGAYLAEHPLIETLHVTGSDKTYDAIVWGPGEGQAERKKKGERRNTRPFSAELGNVTPIVILPSAWTEQELQFQAQRIVSMITNNASFNCVAAKMIVTSKDWPQRSAFLAEIRRQLQESPERKAYYPGAHARFDTLLEACPEAEVLGQRTEEIVPWTLITGLDPKEDSVTYTMEPFCGVTSEVALSGATPEDFLPEAVAFCNDTLWGSLGVGLVVHPSVRKDPASEAALQRALDDLEYGTITLNLWPGIGFGLMTTTWGAHPGHTPDDIGSGEGVVHNTFLFEKPQKSVVYGPFKPLPRPVWFENNRTKARMGPKVVDFKVRKKLSALPGLVWSLIRM